MLADIAPGIPFSSIKPGLAAFDTIPAAGTFQLVAFIGLLEVGFGLRKEEIEAAQIKVCLSYPITCRRIPSTVVCRYHRPLDGMKPP